MLDVNPAFQTRLLTSHFFKVLLIDDRLIVEEAVKGMLARAEDIILFFCQDPAKALNNFPCFV